MWTAFPTRSMTGLFKLYYLAQFGFWLQQIMVINIEERRKDHWQMFTHHIITCLLLIGSYGYYQTKVGNVILCLMDVVDLVFPVSFTCAEFPTLCTDYSRVDCEVAQVHGHANCLRHCFRRLYAFVVRRQTRLLPRRLLVYLRRCPRRNALRMLQRGDWRQNF